MLAHFVRRSLRFEHDILDAFTGILTRMEKFGEFGEHGIGHHIWGLPSKQFGAALQWTTNMPWPSTERVGFPSWSWAGWLHSNDSFPPRNGSFHDIYEGFDDQSTDISVLTGYTVDGDKDIKPVEEDSFERMVLKFNEEARRYQLSGENTGIAYRESELLYHFVPNSPDELAIYIKQTGHSKQYLSQHVFLWASCATLYVDQTPHPATLDFPIRLKEGSNPIGSIRLSPKWRETQHDDEMYFFVSTAGLHESSDPSPNPVELKFKIILMQSCLDDTFPVYKRIQVSHTPIRHTDWALAHPESKFIALV